MAVQFNQMLKQLDTHVTMIGCIINCDSVILTHIYHVKCVKCKHNINYLLHATHEASKNEHNKVYQENYRMAKLRFNLLRESVSTNI